MTKFEFVFEHWLDKDGFWYITLRERDGSIKTYKFEDEQRWLTCCEELRKVQEVSSAVYKQTKGASSTD